ncbi:MAG: lysophospholipase [Deltaproteobacteria bacterium]|nr:lysophospholipase [Deltaproteobacteria bacterium]MBW2420675.1 lysophospholipase [Deltaproteobacteria bacterium]
MSLRPDDPVRRSESRFEGAGSTLLFRRAWLAADPRRLLILVHGFGEHSGRYDELGAWFARRGHAVHAYDQRGHGRSAGPRAYVERFDVFLDDLEAFIQRTSEEHPGLDRTVIGHSMGGLVLLALACERDPALGRVVTSGAALCPSSQLSAWTLTLARILMRVLPRLRLDSGIDPEGLSRDPGVVTRYVEDPLVDTHITLSLAVGMMETAQRILHAGGELTLPLLMLHGEADALCLPQGSRSFFSDLPPGAARDASELHIYPELRHEIFNEPEREKVFSDILGWIDAGDQGGA